MLGGRNTQAGSGNAQQSGQAQGGWGQPQQPQSQQPAAPRNPANEPPMDFDDDIPFLGHGYGICRKAIYAIS